MTDDKARRLRRRTVLTGVGGGMAVLAGCSGGGGDGSDATEATDTDAPASTTAATEPPETASPTDDATEPQDEETQTTEEPEPDRLVSGTVAPVSNVPGVANTLFRRYQPDSGLPESPGEVTSVTNISNRYSLSSARYLDGANLLFTSNAQAYLVEGPAGDDVVIESISPANETFSKEVEVGRGTDAKLPPHYHDGRVYVVNEDTDVRVLDATTGERQDLYTTPDELSGYEPAPVTMANGTLYVGDEEELVAYDLVDRSISSRVSLEQRLDDGFVTADGRLYGYVNGGQFDDTFVYGYDIAAGEQLFAANYERYNIVNFVPLNGTLCIVEGGANQDGITVVDRDSGESRFSVDFPLTDALARLVVDDQRLYYGNGGAAEVAALDLASGKELWRTPTPTEPQAGFAVANGVLYVGGERYLYAYDAETGDLLVEAGLESYDDQSDPPLEGLLPVGDALFGFLDDDVVRLRLS